MKEKSIAELRYLASNGSTEALLELLDYFDPLFQKFAHKFEYEDTYSELRLFFIDLINHFPIQADGWNSKQIVAYIKKSIYTFWIKLSTKNQIRENSLIEFDVEIMDKPSEVNDEQNIILQGIFSVLNQNQKNILYLHYVQGYSIREIAIRLGKTRQAINKTKNQALSILKKQFEIDN